MVTLNLVNYKSIQVALISYLHLIILRQPLDVSSFDQESRHWVKNLEDQDDRHNLILSLGEQIELCRCFLYDIIMCNHKY